MIGGIAGLEGGAAVIRLAFADMSFSERSGWRNLSLARRLLLPIVAAILIAGVVRTATLVDEEGEAIRERVALKAALLSSVLPALLGDFTQTPTDDEIRMRLEGLLRQSLDIRRFEWVLAEQRIVVEHFPDAPYPAWFARFLPVAQTDLRVLVVLPNNIHAELTARLDVTAAMQVAWKRVKAQVQTVLFVVVVLLLAISLILRSSLRGLGKLREAADLIGKGNLYARAAPGGCVEVRTAVAGFNKMADAVANELTLRQQLENALREKQATLLGILDAMGEAVFAVDQQGRLLIANPSACKLLQHNEPFGLPLAELLQLTRSDTGSKVDWPSMLAEVSETGFADLGNVVLSGGEGASLHSLEGNVTALRLHGETNWIVVLRDVSEIKRLLLNAEWQASHDPLTGLPNRLLLADRLHQACQVAERQGTQVAVCLFDLDGFKPVNDRYGHDTGDRLLAECARRVESSLRGMDTVVRLGGDEFVVLLTGLENVPQAEIGIGRILQVIGCPYTIDDIHLQVGASLGYALFPADSADPDTLLRHADQAMYAAKEAGRATWRRYAPDSMHETDGPVADLAEAMAKGQLELFYQPQVNLRTGKVLGFEALLRWRHPERGLLLPGEFLPGVERSAFVEALGDWVILQALAQLADWWRAGFRYTVAVNIAGRHFLKPGFIAGLQNALACYAEVPPEALCLEITESSALADLVHAAAVVRSCRALKVGVEVDDFGTGYASLAYLRQLPVDGLKIDQHFVRDILDDRGDMALVEAVISLSAVFERRVLAEGVESPEHGVLLMRLGCDLAQGYGIARPMPLAEVKAWVAQWQPDPRWAQWADTHWELSDFPLILAQYDHLRWVNRVLLYIEGGALQLTPAELADHHHCRFGHWYDGHGRLRYGHLPEYGQIDASHTEVHRLGREIVELADRGELAAARQRFDQLLQCKERILALLADLQKAVAHGGDVTPEVSARCWETVPG